MLLLYVYCLIRILRADIDLSRERSMPQKAGPWKVNTYSNLSLVYPTARATRALTRHLRLEVDALGLWVAVEPDLQVEKLAREFERALAEECPR